MEEEENQSKINFIPCLKWVKRGVALANPLKVLSERKRMKMISDTGLRYSQFDLSQIKVQ